MRRINPRANRLRAKVSLVAATMYSPANPARSAIRAPAYDPIQPYDGIERGLLGYFINQGT